MKYFFTQECPDTISFDRGINFIMSYYFFSNNVSVPPALSIAALAFALAAFAVIFNFAVNSPRPKILIGSLR